MDSSLLILQAPGAPKRLALRKRLALGLAVFYQNIRAKPDNSPTIAGAALTHHGPKLLRAHQAHAVTQIVELFCLADWRHQY
jgi:hypothetical protein